MTDAPARLSPAEVEKLLADHEAMVWWVARGVVRHTRGRRRGQILEEVAAEVRLWFVKAAGAFDPSKGVTFGGFAVRLARVYGLRALAAEEWGGVRLPPHMIGRAEPPRHASLDLARDADGFSLAGVVAAGEPDPGEPEFPPDFWTEVRRRLTPRQRELVKLRFVEGLTQREVARRVGVTRQRVAGLLGEALARLRRFMPELAGYLR